jgi:hypothetical protein
VEDTSRADAISKVNDFMGSTLNGGRF